MTLIVKFWVLEDFYFLLQQIDCSRYFIKIYEQSKLIILRQKTECRLMEDRRNMHYCLPTTITQRPNQLSHRRCPLALLTISSSFLSATSATFVLQRQNQSLKSFDFWEPKTIEKLAAGSIV